MLDDQRQRLVYSLFLCFGKLTQRSLPVLPAASATVRRRLLFEMFSKTDSVATTSPFAVLVKRLQESLSRMETFEVATAFAGNAADGSSVVPSRFKPPF